LILNKQIALFNSTGQVFTILSFHLDKLAEKKDILTIAHLQNAIRLSTDKKDKICVLDNKVIVLLTKEDTRKITGLIAKIKSNLPSHNKEYVDEVLKYISVCAVKVDETVTNADDIFEQLLSEETQAKNKVEIQ
jgi:circadian clock protein KaiC